LSNLERKNVESITYRFGLSRLPLQAFIGWDEWDDEPWRAELRSQVKTHLGHGDGVLVFDPSGFAKSGRESVGVTRQWCGRLGKVDHCQMAIALGYVSSKGHTLVDQRLFLPKEWTKDTPPGQSRCSHSIPSLSHASPVGLGDVGQKWWLAAPELDCR
jgi:SRSO17 transposase